MNSCESSTCAGHCPPCRDQQGRRGHHPVDTQPPMTTQSQTTHPWCRCPAQASLLLPCTILVAGPQSASTQTLYLCAAAGRKKFPIINHTSQEWGGTRGGGVGCHLALLLSSQQEGVLVSPPSLVNIVTVSWDTTVSKQRHRMWAVEGKRASNVHHASLPCSCTIDSMWVMVSSFMRGSLLSL